MRLLLPLVALTLAAALPDLAHAACPDALAIGASEVQREHSVSDGTLQSIGASCAGDPSAALVNELVRIGQCDAAAQVGRSLQVGAGRALSAAIDAADACLADRVMDKLDDLATAAEVAESEDAAGGVLGGLGTRGSGYGGGGDGVGFGRAATGPAAEPMADAEWAPVRRERASSPRPRASTGAGEYVASTLGKREATIATGARVAWSRLDMGIWFDYDSAGLRPEALATLGALARRLEAMDRGTVLEIVGHTDSRGSWDYNLDLSARRAESVRSALLLAGTPSSAMGTRAMGESDPISSNRTWRGRAQNRRVEFRFVRPVARRLTR